ncbi:hypothetical protein MBLNU459_g2412t2 [Dothideomycetes sp. NU459]
MGIAAYIASGMGLGASTGNVVSTTSQAGITYAQSSYSASSTASGIGLASFTNATADPDSRGASASLNRSASYVGSSNFLTSTGSSSAFKNFTYTGDCWAQWNQFWTLNASSKPQTETSSYTTTTVETLSDYTYWTSDILMTVVVTVSDGAFAQTTFTTISTSESYPDSAVPTATVTRVETIQTEYPSGIGNLSATITPPPCILPSIVAQCQSSWHNWAIHQYASPDVPGNGPSGCSYDAWDDEEFAPTPICRQASVSGSICSGLISSYLSVAEVYQGEDNGRIGDATTFWTSNGTVSKTTDSISNATKIVTSVGLGTTFTSPTVYISFDSLYASDSCNVIGPTYSNTIVAIANTADLSSLYGWGYHNGLQLTTRFNLTDLYVTPVPDSIYESQPRCASSSLSLAADVNQGIMEVRSLNPLWASCIGGINGVYDPPKALQSEGTVLAPTVAWATTTSTSTAEPASSPLRSSAPSTVPAQRSSATTTLPSSTASSDSETSSPVEVPGEQSTQTELGATDISTSIEDPHETSQASAATQDPAKTTNALTILSQAEATSDSGDPQLASSTTLSSPDFPAQIAPSSQGPAAPSVSVLYTLDAPTISSDAGASVTLDNSVVVTAVNDPANPGRLFIAGQTLDVGGSVVSIASTPVSLASGGLLVLGSSTVNVPAAGATLTIGSPSSLAGNAAVFSIGDQTLTAQQLGSAVAVGLQTFVVDGPAATLNGQDISADSAGIVIGSGATKMTVPFIESDNDHQTQSPAGSQAVVTVGTGLYTASVGSDGLTVVAHRGSAVTISKGSPGVTLAGQALSAVSGGILVGTGSQASTIALTPSAEASNAVTIGSQTYTELSQTDGAYFLANQVTTVTISPGGAATSINGQVVSAVSNGIVVGPGIAGNTISLAAIDKTSSILTIGSQQFTIIAQTVDAAVFANGQTTFTLNPGDTATTIGSEVISAATDGHILVGSSTLTLAPIPAPTQAEAANIITVGSETFTLVAQPIGLDVFANAQTTMTLSVDGPAATIDDQILSAAGFSEVVVGSSTARVELSNQILTLGSQTATASAAGDGTGRYRRVGSRERGFGWSGHGGGEYRDSEWKLGPCARENNQDEWCGAGNVGI